MLDLYFKVFFLLLKEKLCELGINLDIASVISDFEMNIVKSIDDMLESPVEGCFFHFSSALKSKVDKGKFKKRYEKDSKFQSFIKQCGALAHLPLVDLERGIQYLEEHFIFEDSEAKDFKAYFMKYIRSYWLYGCYPPSVWNCWGRSEDLTNNNQEGRISTKEYSSTNLIIYLQ